MRRLTRPGSRHRTSLPAAAHHPHLPWTASHLLVSTIFISLYKARWGKVSQAHYFSVLNPDLAGPYLIGPSGSSGDP
jgi:hypothetical protein